MNRVKKLVGGDIGDNTLCKCICPDQITSGLAIQLCENYSERGVNLLSR